MPKVCPGSFVLLVSLACAQEPKPAPPADAQAVVPPTPPPATPAAATTPPRLVGGGRMEHCPTTVEGAEVTILDTADAVEISVTAKDPKAQADIRTDAKHMEEVSKKETAAVRHTGQGEGGGGLGQCPVVLKNTEIAVTEVEGGAKITVKPRDPADLETLKKDVRARHAKAPVAKAAPSMVGTVGGGRMQHCPTTIAGASVSIAEGKDAVEVTISAKDPKDAQATREIRTDAKHLVAVSKKDPVDVKHTGAGEGGGGLGKCPIVLKDTQLTSADVPGGSKISIRPKDPAQLEWLVKEVRSRHGTGSP